MNKRKEKKREREGDIKGSGVVKEARVKWLRTWVDRGGDAGHVDGARGAHGCGRLRAAAAALSSLRRFADLGERSEDPWVGEGEGGEESSAVGKSQGSISVKYSLCSHSSPEVKRRRE